ncbi:MAG: magnesium/cobalt transporter CorA [Thermoleophilia bacterium]
MQALVCSSREKGVMEVASIKEARSHLADPATLVWLDFEESLSDEDTRLLQSMFGFHDLALEDASKFGDGSIHRQRPKIEDYEDEGYIFLVMVAMAGRRQGQALELDLSEIDVFVGANYVVTVHKGKLPEITSVWDDARKRPGLMACGSDRLCYHLLDVVVDNYIDLVDSIEEIIDDLEDAIIDAKAGREAVHDVFALKRQMITFRKTASPLREVVNEMTSRSYPFVREQTLPYLRDVYDHLVRLSDMLDTYRDILTGALDVHLSAVSNSLNLVMKRLTVVATIFMPLTFITGFWGMNFQDMLPLESRVWFWGSNALMVVLTVGMVIYLSYSWVRKWV